MSSAAMILVVLILLCAVLLAGGLFLMDRWLKGIDKEKYWAKTQKKKLKKGKITLSDYGDDEGLINRW